MICGLDGDEVLEVARSLELEVTDVEAVLEDARRGFD